MKKLLILLSVLVLLGFSLSSCLKETKAPDPGFDVNEIGANATALVETPLDLYLQIDRAIRFQRDSIISKKINQPTFTFKMGYVSLTVSPADTTTYPKTITLDFGTDTQKAYQGQMSIKMNGNMRTVGSNCAISYPNLISYGSTITGNDSVFSLGINATGLLLTRYNTHNSQIMGYNSKKATYDGRIIAKYNYSTGTNLMDSIEINAIDANLTSYKLYSATLIKLQMVKGCSYFNIGLIGADLKKSGSLIGSLIYDYSINSTGDADGACDDVGALSIFSKLNLNYRTQYTFVAFKFE